MKLRLSILLCTLNRAASLRQTLTALGNVVVPADWSTELLIIDNGSSDDTAAVSQSAELKNMAVRYLREPRKGQSHARNLGLANASGDVILFTDDDVIPSNEWVTELVCPITDGRCDALTGRIQLSPDLERPWLTPVHRAFLAVAGDGVNHEGEMVGANMAFRRSVLQRVPGFDTELGPGALGFADDTLFGNQLTLAGFRVAYASQAAVVHRLEVSRLQRRYWLNDAAKRGRTAAYLSYHWEHQDLRRPAFRWLSYWTRLTLRRKLQPPPALDSEGCPGWEMSYIRHMAMYWQYHRERRRSRNYDQHGLVKLARPKGL